VKQREPQGSANAKAKRNSGMTKPRLAQIGQTAQKTEAQSHAAPKMQQRPTPQDDSLETPTQAPKWSKQANAAASNRSTPT
jgi:hypothetical protein